MAQCTHCRHFLQCQMKRKGEIVSFCMQSFQITSCSCVQEKEFVIRTSIPMFSEFPDLGEGLTPYLVDLPGSNEACQQKLAKVAKLNVETATAFLYVMTYSELRNNQDYDAIKAIYNSDSSKSVAQTKNWQCIAFLLILFVLLINK